MDETPHALKQCSKCKQIFPRTPQFFSRAKIQKDGLRPACKVCMKAQSKAYNDAHAEQRKQRYQANKEALNEQSRQYQRTHREQIREQKKQAYEANRQEILAKAKRYRQDNKEKVLEKQRESYRRNRETNLRKMKEYRVRHKQESLERDRLYYRAHREQRIAYQKQYRRTHKDQLCEYHKQKYVRRRDIISRYRSEHRDIFRERERRYYRTEHGKHINAAKHDRRRALKMGAGGKFTAQDVANQFKRQRGTCYYCRKKFDCRKRAYHVDHVVPLTRGGANDPSNLVLACPRCNLRKHNKLPHEWAEGNRLL